MRSIRQIFIFTSSFLFLFLSSMALASGHGDAGEMTGKIAGENLSGISLWIVNLYNDHRIVFAIVTLVSMGVIGMLIAYITEFFLKMFGMETTRIEHKE